MMDTWRLPGPSQFLGAVERSLRDGESVVLRFPGDVPSGFQTALHGLLSDSWRWASVGADAVVESPQGGVVLRGLCERFAPRLATVERVTPLDLCEDEDFRGRLIWIDGRSDANWSSWLSFLAAYAQASRNVRVLGRTQFVAPIDGVPPARPARDVSLAVHDWRDVVDEMDLLFLANGRLRGWGVDGLERLLLATTIARVAAWDCGVAERLAEESAEVILGPCEMLQSMARERGWARETLQDWGLGTDSGTGSMHAALASVKDPREIRRRVWSAQVSVLLPIIESRRLNIVREHRSQITDSIRRTGEEGDPDDLEVGDLARVFGRAGFDQEVGRAVRSLRGVRNALAHRQPLAPQQALDFVGAGMSLSR